MKAITIKLTDNVQRFIDERIAAGEFKDANEYIESLIIREVEGEEPKWIQDALIEGIESGPPVRMTKQMWERRKKAMMKSPRAKRGRVA